MHSNYEASDSRLKSPWPAPHIPYELLCASVCACPCMCLSVRLCLCVCTAAPQPLSLPPPSQLVYCLLYKQGIHGRVQLHEETLVTTRASIATLRLMLYEPAAAADIIKADLAGLVLQIMQGPSLESSIATVINFLYHFSKQPTGRQQLLLKLTPDIARSMIDTCLKCLEAPQYDEPALIIATGDIACSLLLCRCCILHTWVTHAAIVSHPAADSPHVCATHLI